MKTLTISTIAGDYYTFERYKSCSVQILDAETLLIVLRIIDKDDNVIFFNFNTIVHFSEKEEKNVKTK